MVRRLIALMFILAVAGGAAAAAPLRACLPECDMEGHAGMHMMECCRKSHQHKQTSAPAAPSAEVCCPHGSQPSPANTNGGRRLPQPNTVQQQAAALPSPGLPPHASPARNYSHTTSSSTKPAYILHLSLLI
jgi:hypothetical protein